MTYIFRIFIIIIPQFIIRGLNSAQLNISVSNIIFCIKALKSLFRAGASFILLIMLCKYRYQQDTPDI